MIEHRVRIKVLQWDDAEFTAAFERALGVVKWADVSLDSRAAADRVEALLRDGGFPSATVDFTRSVDDVLRGVAHWLVQRDGPVG